MKARIEATVARLLGSALDAGLNVIDTARVLRRQRGVDRQNRRRAARRVLSFHQGGHPHGQESGANWSPASILESIERSLRRLRTDRLDLVHLHSCPEAVLKKGDAIAALQTAREKGYTRFIGYSGDSHAADYAVACGAFDSLQISVNIADQEAIDHALPAAQKARMGVIAKRPLANVAWRTGQKPENSYHHTYWERLRKLDYPFLHDPTWRKSVATALRFTLAAPGVCTAIVGTTNPGALGGKRAPARG